MDPVNAIQRIKYACELAYKVDVFVIVEAHGQDGSDSVFREHLSKTHEIFYFPGTTQATGGVVICLRNRLISSCGKPVADVLDKGRIICLTCTSGDENLGILAAHIDPHYTVEKKKHLLKMMAAEMCKFKDILWLVCGDFNFEAFGDRAYNVDRGAFAESNSSEQLGLTWNDCLGALVEHHQPDFTRAQNGPHGTTLSRIDRIYSNLPAWRLLTAEIRTTTVGRVTDDGRLSDHVPVLSFICHAKDPHTRPLSLWTTKDPFYIDALRTAMHKFNFEEMSPQLAVKQIKICMRSASQHVIQKSLRRGAETIEEQIFWSLVCARALFHSCARRVVHAMVAYPFLESFVLVNVGDMVMAATNLEGLSKHISDLMRQSLDRLRGDVERASEKPEYQKNQQVDGIRRLQDCWATKGRKVSLQGARDLSGNVISDPEEAAEVFIAHWRKVAERKPIDVQKAREFLKLHMRKLPVFRTVLTFEEFMEMIRELPDSACGPDGIPYAAWRHAPTHALRILYHLYCSLFTNAEVADDFNYSWLVLLAKGEHEEDDQIVARMADDTRPVSLANSDSKICESALNKPLARAVGTWAASEQRGFLQDRMMVDNVIEMDTYGRIISLYTEQHPGTKTSNDIGRAVMAFFDFAMAFPSVAWTYMWMCMRYSGLPRPYIRAFKKIYANNVHFMRFMGKVYKAYTNASGVKTGGTASGIIFVLCIDPFLLFLRSRCGPRDFGRAFADDIGYIICNIESTLPKFADCFAMFGIVSNVKIKVKKTVIVPLWTQDIEEVARIVKRIVPAWENVKIALCGKYLGMYLGPGSGYQSWTAPLNKYIARVQLARETGAGFLSSVLEYNIMCVTTLCYVGQFCATTPQVLATEARMLQRLTGCPRYTFTKEALWSLKSLGMTTNYKSVQVCTTAAMVRMTLQTSTVFVQMRQLFENALNDDECMVHSFVRREARSFDTPAIITTMQKAIDSAFLPDIQHAAWRLHLESIRRNILDGAFQKHVTEYLCTTAIAFDACNFLSRRMARFRPSVSAGGQEWWDFCGPFVIQLCRFELEGSPQCVVATFLKTVLNGWATSRRLKLQEPRHCIFACGSKQDCIEHYLRCPTLEAVWGKIMHCDWGPFEARLAVGCADGRGRIQRVIFLYGVFAAYNHLRHNNLRGTVVDVCTNIVRSRITYALGMSSKQLRKKYTNIQGCNLAAGRSEKQVSVGDVIFNFRKRAHAASRSNVKRARIVDSKQRLRSCM